MLFVQIMCIKEISGGNALVLPGNVRELIKNDTILSYCVVCFFVLRQDSSSYTNLYTSVHLKYVRS